MSVTSAQFIERDDFDDWPVEVVDGVGIAMTYDLDDDGMTNFVTLALWCDDSLGTDDAYGYVVPLGLAHALHGALSRVLSGEESREVWRAHDAPSTT